MVRTVVVFGASGKQGGAVVDAFLGDTSFKVRAVLRDSASNSAQKLERKGVQVVQGDLLDSRSLIAALQGAHVVYAMTADIGVLLPSLLKQGLPSIVEEAYRLEKNQGQNLLRALDAIQDTLELFIFSGLSAARRLSGGEFQKIYHFDAKAELIEDLETTHPHLVSKTYELQLGMFMTNLRRPGPMKPTKQPDGRYRVLIPHAANAPVPFIDPNHDPAIFVKALVTQAPPPEPRYGKVPKYAGYAQYTTFAQYVELLNKHVPGEFYCEEISLQAWADEIPLPGLGIELAEMWKYVEKVGYFGGDQGRTSIITGLKLVEEPTRFADWFVKQDWLIVDE